MEHEFEIMTRQLFDQLTLRFLHFRNMFLQNVNMPIFISHFKKIATPLWRIYDSSHWTKSLLVRALKTKMDISFVQAKCLDLLSGLSILSTGYPL